MQQAPRQADFHERSQARQHFLEARFSEDYPSYQYIFVEFFLEHLSEVSRAFKGDLQQMLVLALIGQVYLRWVRSCDRQGLTLPQEPPREASISASRLADCTGIPRETVRRKLVLLQQQNWVDRLPDGRWSLVAANSQTTAARQDFADLDRAAMKRTARLLARLEDFADAGRI